MMEHRVGQNLYLSSWAPTGTQVADSWYSENVDYDYSTGKAKTANALVGHFTQLVLERIKTNWICCCCWTLERLSK